MAKNFKGAAFCSKESSEVTFMFLAFFFSPGHEACGILVLLPQPGIELAPPAVEVKSLNHWTTNIDRKRKEKHYNAENSHVSLLKGKYVLYLNKMFLREMTDEYT